MASRSPSLGASTHPLTTTLLVPSIHCPTCASFIETLIKQIDAEALVEVSIISHRVTIRHGPRAAVAKMVRALGESGYEVHTVAADPESQATVQSYGKAAAADDDFVIGGWFSQSARPWNLGGWLGQKRARRRHMDNCRECRVKKKASAAGTASDASHGGDEPRSEDGASRGPVVVVDSAASAPPQIYQATVTVDGMSCSSCVGRITESLMSQTWVEAADVGLMTRTAVVRFRGADKQQDIVELIESAGYDAKVEQVEKLAASSPKDRDGSSDLWRAELSIGGMTCSSCVGKITTAVEGLAWTRTVDVNLLSSSAVVTFEGRAHLGEVMAAIADAGYDASLGDLVNTGRGEARGGRRSVQILIGDMYCEHCPARAVAAVAAVPRDVDVDEAPTLSNPIMSVSYTPEAPGFTVRTILAAIAEADAAFRPTIYHPPTVEERARQMHARSRRRILYRLLLSVAAAIPALIIGVVYLMLVPENNPSRVYLAEKLNGVSRAEWSLLVIATPVYFFCADLFHRRVIKEIYALWRPGSPVPLLRRFYRFGSMDMLVSFATTIAYFGSIAELAIAATQEEATAGPERSPYFDSVIFLTMFLLSGRIIEAYSKAKTGEAVTKLGDLRPKEALLVTPSGAVGHDSSRPSRRTTTVPIDTLEAGDTVVVVHGGSPPWDGVLLDDEAEFAEASLTGESRPVRKSAGDDIYSGTINKGAPVTMRIHGAAGDSLLDSIIRVVRQGQSKRAPIERLADIITGYFVPFVTLVAIVAWLTWLGLGLSGRLPADYMDARAGGWPFWSLQFAIAIFVIACPCGMGLAAPTALFVGGGLAAQHGILAKGGGEAFQEASSIDIVVFDKTGTLTEGGELKLTDQLFDDAAGAWRGDKLLASLGETERNSSHPIGKAFVSYCDERDLHGPAPKEVQELPGKGMRALVSSDDDASPPTELIVGNETLMADYGVVFGAAVASALESWKDQAKSVVLVATRDVGSPDWTPAAAFATSDPVRAESRPVIEALRARGVDVWMISGDNPRTARAVGAMVSIAPDHIIAGVLPEQKADKVKYLQGSLPGRRRGALPFGLGGGAETRAVVAMVGDGVNDSPALTAADVGIAIGAGSDVAISAADFVLIKSDLGSLLTLVELSRAVFRRVKFNFAWASVYNLVALPIAAGVLYPIKTNGSHTRLDAVWASLAMALSSVSVICSSLLLRSRLPLVGFRRTSRADK
ncbi:ATPase, P-type, heavy metal translocating [Metarhizium album ARSEF 1941]|uniref:ATPase, P-type, heavy metal translocating n=1 Tax=Metarhizium album (strain ARSEF 1941) TaxID=1081103 RepID=A0A0B2WNX0_METAS|nr:ATPase, P-type, heavy metal translocating [Metarhizium album ARSEF 1941]KHN95698.1 ATPase, P-type, heavy metal translocating [Metarhizium album ARSEF 1941]